MKDVGIYGTGGFGREVAWLLSSHYDCRAVAYIHDGDPQPPLNGLPVLDYKSFTTKYPDAFVAVAVSDPCTRENLVRLSKDSVFLVLRDSFSRASKSVSFGEGCILCSNSTLTVDITIGRHVHINLNCTVGHDSMIGDFCTLAPGVHVSGNVHIGQRVYIGTGANIINGTPNKPLVIGDNCIIGAGACVTQDCEPGCLYVGVPASLKKRYP